MCALFGVFHLVQLLSVLQPLRPLPCCFLRSFSPLPLDLPLHLLPQPLLLPPLSLLCFPSFCLSPFLLSPLPLPPLLLHSRLFFLSLPSLPSSLGFYSLSFFPFPPPRIFGITVPFRTPVCEFLPVAQTVVAELLPTGALHVGTASDPFNDPLALGTLLEVELLPQKTSTGVSTFARMGGQHAAQAVLPQALFAGACFLLGGCQSDDPQLALLIGTVPHALLVGLDLLLQVYLDQSLLLLDAEAEEEDRVLVIGGVAGRTVEQLAQRQFPLHEGRHAALAEEVVAEEESDHPVLFQLLRADITGQFPQHLLPLLSPLVLDDRPFPHGCLFPLGWALH